MKGPLLNTTIQPEAVGDEKCSSIWESTPHWTYAKRDRYPRGTGLGKYFDPGSVRDTFYGRMCNLVNRIKRLLPFR